MLARYELEGEETLSLGLDRRFYPIHHITLVFHCLYNHLFGPLKEALRGRKISRDKTGVAVVKAWIHPVQRILSTEDKKIRSKMGVSMYISVQGDYMEK